MTVAPFAIPTQAVFYEVAADKVKQQAESWQVMTSTETKVFCIQPDVPTKPMSWRDPADPLIRGTLGGTEPWVRVGMKWSIAARWCWAMNHPPA